jgi:hypothetical protein
MRLYWPAVRGALRRAWAVLQLLAALAAGIGGGLALVHAGQHPPCVIVGFSPGPNGHPAYTYSPAGCTPTDPP